MQKEAKTKIRKRLLGIVLCLALVLTGISVPAVKTYAADNEMSVTEFDGTEKIIPVGTKIVPTEGQKLSVYSYPDNGRYLVEMGDSWIAEKTYLVTEKWANLASLGDYIVLASVVSSTETVKVTSVSIPSNMMMVNHRSKQLTATVLPENATNKAVTWAVTWQSGKNSINDTVVTVDQDGVVTAVSLGKAIVTVTTVDGSKTAQCVIDVYTDAPSATPTPTPTTAPTATPTPTAAPTATPTPTAALTATPTPTAALTAAPTPTAALTAAPAPTQNPAQTTDPTSVQTPTPTPAADHVGDVKNDTHAEQNTAEAALDENTDELTAKVLNDEDRTALAAGKNAVILLTVTDGAATITAEDQQLIESARGAYTLGSYLDITLWKQIDGEEAQKVTATNGAVTIRFQVPDNLLNTDSSVTRTYYIIRVHDGVTDILPCTFDPATGTASFETDRFSSYAVVYSDSTAAALDESPKTGVIDNTYLWCLLALLSGAGMVYLGKKSRLTEE